VLEGFVPLEAALRAPPAVRPSAAEPAPAESAPAPPPASPARGDRFAPLAADLALARLAAFEAYERAVPRLLHALAREVLARELSLAGPDVQALSRALVAEFASEEPVAFVVAREDAARFPSGVPVRVDPRLRAGDLVLEVRDGEIDARFAVRLEDAIAAADAA
jgi:flagellar biosynthesis/type III secretory pathway protein FliH